ncbi:MAG: hypothetical protein AAFY19_01355 [Pseudomonadota bacterium]
MLNTRITLLQSRVIARYVSLKLMRKLGGITMALLSAFGLKPFTATLHSRARDPRFFGCWSCFRGPYRLSNAGSGADS